MAQEKRNHFRLTRITGSAAAAVLLLGAAFITGAQARHVARASHATPTYGGAYSFRLSTAPDCLDPQKTAAAASSTIDSFVFDPLLSLNNKGHYVGDLATKFKASKGGTRLVFQLRKGVVFSNGDPFTATDVKFTFDRALDPATKSPVSASQLGSVSAVKVLNKYAVELDLKTPFRPLLSNLAGSYTSILDHKSIPNQSDTCAAPIGTGPYKVQSTGAAFSDVVLVANKRHNFGPSWVINKGVPYITKVEFKTIASDATAISEMLSGGIDIADIPGTQLSRIQGNKNFAIHKEAAQNLIFVEFNTAHPPFNDPQARKAFVEIIDRKNIVKAALNNLGQAVYGPIPPAIPFYDKSAAKLMPKFSISAASKLVQSTHATGPYHFLSVGVAPFSTMAEIIQADAAQAGMQLQIDAKGGLGDFISAAAKGDFDVLTLNYSYNDPDVLYYLLHSSQGHGAGLNWTNATNPTVDSLIVKGRTTLQTKKVAPIYNKLQETINKQLEFVGVADQVPLLGIRSTIKGYHTNSAGGISLQDLYIKSK